MVPLILIVDDENDFIELLQYKLAGQGYDFIVANDGVQALSQARQFKPDLILLDILLPDLDGLSVCEIMRRQPSTKKIPVIFMSASRAKLPSARWRCRRTIFSPSRSICRASPAALRIYCTTKWSWNNLCELALRLTRPRATFIFLPWNERHEHTA